MSKTGAAIAGGLVAAFGASLCCVGPLLAVFVGVGGAGLSATFEPLRPYLLALSAVLFVWGGIALYRRSETADCAPGAACRTSSGRRSRPLFWAAVGAAAVLASFPWWSQLLV